MAIRIFILLFTLINAPFVGLAKSINSAHLLLDTSEALPQCLHYKITGMCFWLDCVGPFCSINTSLKVSHYVPDSVVSVYQHHKDNPWLYARKIVDPVFYQAAKPQVKAEFGFSIGGGNSSTNSQRDLDTHFKEADVIGNPGLAMFYALPGLLLPGVSTPFAPNYSSLLDAAAWRSTWLEMLYPGALIPGKDDIGSFPFNVWGSLYPRNGFINQPLDVKAAAVIAQRAANIATQANQPHVYYPLSDSCGDHCTAEPARENDPKAVQWQMVYPIKETQCSVFGVNDVASLTPWKSKASVKAHGNYVWIMWRHYHGCIPNGGKYLGSVDW